MNNNSNDQESTVMLHPQEQDQKGEMIKLTNVALNGEPGMRLMCKVGTMSRLNFYQGNCLMCGEGDVSHCWCYQEARLNPCDHRVEQGYTLGTCMKCFAAETVRYKCQECGGGIYKIWKRHRQDRPISTVDAIITANEMNKDISCIIPPVAWNPKGNPNDEINLKMEELWARNTQG